MEDKFRLQAKNLFLTYSQVGELSRERVKEFLIEKLAPIDYIIAKEKHEDGGDHFHCYLELAKKSNIKNARFLDIDGIHGRYEAVKSKKFCMQYTIKKGDYDSSFDVQQRLKSMENHTAIEKNINFLKQIEDNGIAKSVRDGVINLRNLIQVEKNLNRLKELETVDEREDIPSMLENPWNLELKLDTDNKCCNYWIFSKGSNYGKTTWLKSLLRKYICALWNINEEFQPQIHRDTQMILFDEFGKSGKGLSLYNLNLLCDGTYWITAKNRDPWQLSGQPIVIITSNLDMHGVYGDSPNLINLRSRFEEIDLKDYALPFINTNPLPKKRVPMSIAEMHSVMSGWEDMEEEIKRKKLKEAMRNN